VLVAPSTYVTKRYITRPPRTTTTVAALSRVIHETCEAIGLTGLEE
jgi:hypothetical protein